MRAAIGLEAATFGVLAATGGWLSVRYRPRRWETGGGGYVSLVRGVHRAATVVFVVIALAGVVGAAVALTKRLELVRRWMLAPAAALLLLAAAAAATARRLPWDALALDAGTGPANRSGLWRPAFDPHVRFFLVGRHEVGRDTVRIALMLHAFVVPVAILVAGVATYLAARRRPMVDGGSGAG